VTVQQVVMEAKITQTGLVTLNMEGMKHQIDETGRALVYGIYFDTDDAGDVDHNVKLSRRRAKAVVDRLTDEHNIAGSRPSAQGVGPFALAAMNESQSGKGKNRRVELVKRLTSH